MSKAIGPEGRKRAGGSHVTERSITWFRCILSSSLQHTCLILVECKAPPCRKPTCWLCFSRCGVLPSIPCFLLSAEELICPEHPQQFRVLECPAVAVFRRTRLTRRLEWLTKRDGTANNLSCN